MGRISKKLRWAKKRFRKGKLKSEDGRKVTKGDDISRMCIGKRS